MVGQTLTGLRDEIEALAAPDGSFRVLCARTGERPVPSGDLRFPDRETAAEAAALTERYREALRRYDPRLPRRDPIVCETPRIPSGPGAQAGPEFEDPSLIEFCHRVVAAAFETLVEHGHRGVETAVMDAYLARAEQVADRDRLCLALLRSLAAEVTARLGPAEQTRVLRGTAARLPGPDETEDALGAALAQLETASLVAGYAREGDHSLVVDGYALEPVDGRLPTFPLAVDVLRRRPGEPFGIAAAARSTDGWRLSLSTVEQGLASAPVTRPG